VKIQLRIVKTSYGFKLDIKGGCKRTQGLILKLIEVIKKILLTNKYYYDLNSKPS